jgi:hypothetical protein
VSICEVKEGSKLAIELDPKLSIFGHEPDLFDELAGACGGLKAGVLVIQGLGEIGDLLAVEFGKVRMQARHGRGRCFKSGEELHAPGLQDRHLIPYRGAGDARFDGFDQSADLTLGLFKISRGAVAAPVLLGSPPINFAAEFVDESRDELGASAGA